MSITKNKLVQLYIHKKMSMLDVSNFFNVSESVIHKKLHEYGIKVRPQVKPKTNIPDKDLLKKLHHCEGKTIKEIANIFNVNRNLASKWFNTHGIRKNYFVAHKKPSYQEISKLYASDKLTVKQLCSIYKVSRNTVNKWLKSYNIPIRSTQKRYSHLRAVPITNKQKEFIVGTILGDAYLSPKNRLELKHGKNQLNYILWKKSILSNYINHINEKQENLGLTYRCYTINHHGLKVFRDMFYKNNKKIVPLDIANYLTAFSMAVWIMDDGWRQKNSIKISSESFSYKDHEILRDAIKVNFNINVKICTYMRNGKQYNYLSFNKRNSKLLTSLISEYVIDSMKYKLIP